MIGASKRQRDKLTADGQLEHHLHLAKQFFWQRQLLHCAFTALAASLLAYVLALPLGWHALLVGVGFGAGFLWMNRNGLERALRYIEDGIGLSYSTALEHPAHEHPAHEHPEHAPTRDASHQASDWQEALYQSVLQRAHYRIRRLDAPTLQPWWLPIVAVALMLLIVPDVTWTGNRATPSDATGQTRPLASSAEETVNPAPRQDANPQPDGERSPADASNATTDAGDELAPAQDSADNGEDSASPASERDALSRFVDNLTEGSSATANNSDNANANDANPDNEGRTPQTGGSATPRAGDQDFRQVPPDDRSRDAQSADTPPASGDGQQRSQGSQEGQEQGESGESGAESGEGEQRVNSGESPDDSPQGDSQAESGDPQAGDQAGDNENPQAGDQRQPQTSPNSPPEETGQGQTDSAQAGDQQGEGESPEDALSDPSNGAGSQGGFGEDNSENLSNMSNPEQLEGLLEQGTINTGGQVRLPGDDDVMLPAGSAPEAYQQGVERALSEGRIPVEYQEILRSYFR